MVVLATRLSSRVGFPPIGGDVEGYRDGTSRIRYDERDDGNLYSAQQLRLSDDSLNLAEAMAVATLRRLTTRAALAVGTARPRLNQSTSVTNLSAKSCRCWCTISRAKTRQT